MAFTRLTDDQCREAAEAAAKFPTKIAAANSLGVDHATFQHRLRVATRRVVDAE